jgi:putative transposase
LRAAVGAVRRARPFSVNAWVVLSDHMHAVWTLPEGDSDYSLRWAAIKARFTIGLRELGLSEDDAQRRRPGFSPASAATSEIPAEYPVVVTGRYAGPKPGLGVRKREVAVWQRRFWEHHIRDARDFDAHGWYCWNNPVKHGFVERAVDWPYSWIPCEGWLRTNITIDKRFDTRRIIGRRI